jgi:GDP-L-fucose synthase
MNHYDESGLINIGTGSDITIHNLAKIICDVVGFKGSLKTDTSKPDGTPQKLLDINKISSLGWKARIGLEEGIKKTYEQVKDEL